jgi:hypothetical protein
MATQSFLTFSSYFGSIGDIFTITSTQSLAATSSILFADSNNISLNASASYTPVDANTITVTVPDILAAISPSQLTSSLLIVFLNGLPVGYSGLFFLGDITVSPSSGPEGTTVTVTATTNVIPPPGSIDFYNDVFNVDLIYPSPGGTVTLTRNSGFYVNAMQTNIFSFTASAESLTLPVQFSINPRFAFGTNPNIVVYTMNMGNYTVTNLICFKADSKIVCFENNKEVEINIQDIKKDTMVKTFCNGYLPVNVIGKNTCYNPKTNERVKDRLYRLSKDKYPELKEDLIVTGCHAILVDYITDEQRNKINKVLGSVYVTDNKYRLLTFADERSEVYKEECGEIDVYHVALGSDESRNYGIYANGLLVESCFINRVKNEMNVIA